MQVHYPVNNICTFQASKSILESKSALQTKADELSAVLLKLEHVADDVWRSADESAAATFEQEIDESDPIRSFNDMRDMHTTLKGVSEALRSLTGTWKTRASEFDEKVENIGCHIERLAMNCGMNRLPDELLLEILAYVAVSLQSTVLLSHVSRHFRAIILGSRKLWRFKLLDGWTPEQILTVAERRGFKSLEAFIHAHKEGGQLRDSTKIILELHAHLQELSISSLNGSFAEKVQQYFLDGRMQQLRDLIFYQNYRQESVPSLSFPGPCHLPSLRVMSTSIIPHPSLSRNLVRCTIHDSPFLGDLLEFLSCTSMLQQLCLYMNSQPSDQEATSSLGSISLPSLASLSINFITSSNATYVRNLIGKIVPFTAEKLSLFIDDDDIGGILALLQSTPAVRELDIDVNERLQIDLARLFSLISNHLTILSLGDRIEPIFDPSTLDSTRFESHRLQMLRFKVMFDLTPACVIALRDFFLTFAGENFMFEFESCKYMNDGAFRLRDVESAFKDPR